MKYMAWVRTHLDVRMEGSDGEVYTRCPFKRNHKNGDMAPSFNVNVRKGVYVCHGCGEKGTLHDLADKLQVSLTAEAPKPDDILARVHELRAGVAAEEVSQLEEAFNDRFLVKRRWTYWIDERGIAPDVVEQFGLGYDRSSNSATIPLRDLHGRLQGVIRRRLAKEARPRYVYPKGFKVTWHLWGAYAARGHASIAVCEGSVDALALWSVGIPAVALLGSRISAQQANIISKLGCREVIVVTDRDTAGRTAARQVRERLQGVLVKMGTYRSSWEGKDPAALTPVQRKAIIANATVLPRTTSDLRKHSTNGINGEKKLTRVRRHG